MSMYLTLSHIKIQNANCVAGVTYGFPAITQFLGFSHALSRKLKSKNIKLGGCAVICHQHQALIYKQNITKNGKTRTTDYYFKQTRNPAAGRWESDKIGNSPSIIEEGKIHLTVSLVIECVGFNGANADQREFEQYVKKLCYVQRLAGGVITNIQEVYLDTIEDNTDLRRIRCRLLPGFVLLDRSKYLAEHLESLKQENDSTEMLDAWLDFSALKYKAEPMLQKDEKLTSKTKAQWEHQKSTKYPGWLVPITTGYQAISDPYPKGVVANTRKLKDNEKFCFVEAVYGIGEWQSPHKIENIQQILWNYSYRDGWYLCKQNIEQTEEVSDDTKDDIDMHILNIGD